MFMTVHIKWLIVGCLGVFLCLVLWSTSQPKDTPCCEDTRLEIRELMDGIGADVYPYNEEQILTELWEYAHDNPDIALSLNVTDAEGNIVTNNLEEGIPPLTVTLNIFSSDWTESATFTPLSVDSVYLLLRE